MTSLVNADNTHIMIMSEQSSIVRGHILRMMVSVTMHEKGSTVPGVLRGSGFREECSFELPVGFDSSLSRYGISI